MQSSILLSSGADIDIMVHGLFSYELFGHTFWITTTHVSILIVMIVLIGFSLAANRAMKHAADVPGGFQNVVELIVEKLDGMVCGVMGKSGGKFVNYVGTIFIFILVSNLSGLFGLRPPTADYGVTFPLALLSFILIHFKNSPVYRYVFVSWISAAMLPSSSHAASRSFLCSGVSSV